MDSITFTEILIKTRSDNPKHPQKQVTALAQSLDKPLDGSDPMVAQQIIDDHCRAVLKGCCPAEAIRFEKILESRAHASPLTRRVMYINSLFNLFGSNQTVGTFKLKPV